jgi:hypothetical protein
MPVMSDFFINAKERSTESEEKLENSETQKWRNKGAYALRGYGVRGRQRVEGCW